jgi:hypothetical protein
MKHSTFFSICLIAGMILVGCSTGAAVNTASPSNPALPANTAVPTVPANTPAPLNTTTVDLTNVSLKTEDLPGGYHKFTDAEIKSMGVDSMMNTTTTFIKAMVKPFDGVVDLVKSDLYGKSTKTEEFLVNVFFYPLSSSSIFQIDMGFSNPAIISQFLKGAQVLPEYSGVGNASTGLAQTVQGYNLRILVFRRNNTMIALVEANKNATSVFDLKAIGQKMDQYVLAEYK